MSSGEPEQLSRSSSNAICDLRAVRSIDLKPSKATTIKVAYARQLCSKDGKGHRSIGRSWYDHDRWHS